MADPRILELVSGVLSFDSDLRKASEEQLEGLRRNQVDFLCIGLIDIGRSSKELAVRQSALLVLKNAVSKTWSVGFEQFEGPVAINYEIKGDIKERLLQLLADPESKIRSASAAMLAKIALVEFPDEWPDLARIIIELITAQQNDSGELLLNGGLVLLREMLSDAISEKEFFKMGNEIISSLFNIAGNGLLLFANRTLAVQCFTSCIQFFLMIDDNQHQALEEFAQAVVTQWVNQIIIPIINDTTIAKSTMVLKLEVYNLIREIDSAFLWFADRFMTEKILPALWRDLLIATPHYVKVTVNNSEEELPDDDSNKLAESTECSASAWVIGILETITLAVSSDDITTTTAGLTRHASEDEILHVLTQLALVPMSDILDWEQDLNTYVAEELEMSIDRRVRPMLSQIITRSQVSLKSAIGYPVSVANSGQDWTFVEAALYLLGSYLLDTDDEIITSDLCQSILPLIKKCILDSSDSLLQCRSLIVGSLICKYMSFEEPALSTEIVESTIQIASTTESSTVKIASLMTLDKIASRDPSPLENYQGQLFTLISSLVQDADEETPSLLVSHLITVINLNVQAAIKEPLIVKLLFTLAAKDTSKIDLNIEVNEAFELLAEKSTELGSFEAVVSNALPQLLEIINHGESNIWEYSPDLVLALDLLSALLSRAPESLSFEVVKAVLAPLYKAITQSSDNEVLQSASETFTHLIVHGSKQISSYRGASDDQTGPEMVLQVASKLLDPTREEESGVLNAGKIVLAILSGFGEFITPELFAQIIKATAVRLVVSENVVLSENLIMVFCKLVLESASQVIDMLYNIDNGSTLTGVMAKWLATFEVIRGYQYIKENILALQKIFLLNDNRVSSIEVQGDPILPGNDIILTRSRTKNLKYTRISVLDKIVRLLIKELSSVPYEDKLAKSAMKREEALDDEWEDVFDVADDGHASDLETRELIVNWLKEASQYPQFTDIYNRLSDHDKQILTERVQ